jgi:peptidoglycan/xylan/chitin deacetylase (PgdA/CDA1 family)
MSLKSLLLGPYYCGTLPLRHWRSHAAMAAGRAPVMIVYYHRVADDRANSWTVSFDLFRRQIEWVQRHFELVSLEEAQQRIRAPRNARPCVSITFDDGYAENCDRALPWLIERRVPCTYFVVSWNVLHGGLYPHDRANGHSFAPNTPAQLRDLAAHGIEIGAHSRTHADIGAIRSRDNLYDEVVACGDELRQALGLPIRYFAFPFGMHANLQPAAFALARQAGYEAVCSAYGGYNYPGDDAWHLQRIGGEGPLLRLKNWLTVDPLKERRVRRYEYRLPESNPDSACEGTPAGEFAGSRIRQNSGFDAHPNSGEFDYPNSRSAAV